MLSGATVVYVTGAPSMAVLPAEMLAANVVPASAIAARFASYDACSSFQAFKETRVRRQCPPTHTRTHGTRERRPLVRRR